jgi:hypothetical protein
MPVLTYVERLPFSHPVRRGRAPITFEQDVVVRGDLHFRHRSCWQILVISPAREIRQAIGCREGGEQMKTRLGRMLVASSSVLLTVPATILSAGGGGSGSGGGGAAVPRIEGTWHGQYTWAVPAFGGPLPANVTNQALMTLVEDAAGNLGGRFCYGAVPSPGCLPLKGKVQSNGALQVEFASGGGATFKLNGTITGTMACLDGTTGLAMAGVFQVREGSGTFGFDDCPVQ